MEVLKEMAAPLLAWYDANARVLPWRSEPSPYRVWVSEIMLQQTRVEAVKPYFERFIGELPSIRDLAECPEERLLKLWEGLGYYNRVRNMQKAAKQIQEQYGGEMPADYEALRALPGIGSYTAGAIASIAFGIAVPAVDGNVLRVMTRLTMDEDDILRQSVKTRWECALTESMPKKRAGDFNQALMELGATVCVPNGRALCEKCPLQALCRAKAEGRVMDFPCKAPKKPRRMEDWTILVILDGNRTALRRRPRRGLLAGLYELPNLAGHVSREEALAYVEEQKLMPLYISDLGEAKHIFSHVEWRMIGYAIRVAQFPEKQSGDMIFVEPDETREAYPIPSAFEAYAAYLRGAHR